MKKITKILLKIFALPFIIFLIYSFYLFSKFNTFIDHSQIEPLIKEVKSTPMSNQKIYDVYSQVNNEILSKTTWSDFFQWLRGNNQTCPCYLVARGSYINKAHKLSENDMVIALRIENKLTQSECLNYLLMNFDFMYGAIGIESAADIYYGKTIDNLTEEEVLGLIAMTISPTLYNPKKNKTKSENKVKELKEILNNQNRNN